MDQIRGGVIDVVELERQVQQVLIASCIRPTGCWDFCPLRYSHVLPERRVRTARHHTGGIARSAFRSIPGRRHGPRRSGRLAASSSGVRSVTTDVSRACGTFRSSRDTRTNWGDWGNIGRVLGAVRCGPVCRRASRSCWRINSAASGGLGPRGGRADADQGPCEDGPACPATDVHCAILLRWPLGAGGRQMSVTAVNIGCRGNSDNQSSRRPDVRGAALRWIFARWQPGAQGKGQSSRGPHDGCLTAWLAVLEAVRDSRWQQQRRTFPQGLPLFLNLRHGQDRYYRQPQRIGVTFPPVCTRRLQGGNGIMSLERKSLLLTVIAAMLSAARSGRG